MSILRQLSMHRVECNNEAYPTLGELVAIALEMKLEAEDVGARYLRILDQGLSLG